MAREHKPTDAQLAWIQRLATQFVWHMRRRRYEQADWTHERYYEALSKALEKHCDIYPLTLMWARVTQPVMAVEMEGE